MTNDYLTYTDLNLVKITKSNDSSQFTSHFVFFMLIFPIQEMSQLYSIFVCTFLFWPVFLLLKTYFWDAEKNPSCPRSMKDFLSVKRRKLFASREKKIVKKREKMRVKRKWKSLLGIKIGDSSKSVEKCWN